MKQNSKKHCCKLMNFFIEEKKVAIYYNPLYREYFIKLKSFNNGKYPIYNCPWCGTKFPKSLVDKYFETLKEEYKIEYNPISKKYFEPTEDFEEIPKSLPKEFKSEDWWKKRGL